MKIFRYEITDSTNTRAREYARLRNAEFPAVFVADGQTAGRGRRGRSFDSELGGGLYISFLFRPEDKAFDPAKITVRAAVAVCRAIDRACGLSVGIKWVNDIFVSNKKLGGILTEGEFDADTGALSFAVCGIGINLFSRHFPEELSNIATTVEDELLAKPDKKMLEEILTDEFFKENGDFISEYRRRSAVIGKRVLVTRLSGESFCAKVIDITDKASLLVQKEDGSREELISAEVSINPSF
jgi:BirA family biotin operon repressor/biotin-[acetyl-CoA-carboxylase] ligase